MLPGHTEQSLFGKRFTDGRLNGGNFDFVNVGFGVCFQNLVLQNSLLFGVQGIGTGTDDSSGGFCGRLCGGGNIIAADVGGNDAAGNAK